MTTRLHAAQEFLEHHHVFSLALGGEEGPHACSLFYRNMGFNLFWVSDPKSLHSRIIETAGRSKASVTIAPDYTDFKQIRGLQMTGTARRLDNVAASLAIMPLFAQRYPFFASLTDHAAVLAAMAKAKLYCFEPERATFVDNTLKFGHKDQLAATDLAGVLGGGPVPW